MPEITLFSIALMAFIPGMMAGGLLLWGILYLLALATSDKYSTGEDYDPCDPHGPEFFAHISKGK